MKTNLIILAIIAAATYALTLYLGQGTNLLPASATKDTNQSVSYFEFTDINGRAHEITDFKGKKVILNFWASWCAPCIKEFPILLDAAHDNPDTVLIALSSDLNEEAITKFMAKTAFKFDAPNILIALDTDQAITSGIFNTFKLPETLIIDEDQTIRHKFIGANWSAQDLQNWLDKI